MGILLALIATISIIYYLLIRWIKFINSYETYEEAGRRMAEAPITRTRSSETHLTHAPNIAKTPILRLQGEFDEDDTFWNVVCQFRESEDSPFQNDSLGLYRYDDLQSAKDKALHFKYIPKHWRNIQIVQMRKQDEFSDE